MVSFLVNFGVFKVVWLVVFRNFGFDEIEVLVVVGFEVVVEWLCVGGLEIVEWNFGIVDFYY